MANYTCEIIKQMAQHSIICSITSLTVKPKMYFTMKLLIYPKSVVNKHHENQKNVDQRTS